MQDKELGMRLLLWMQQNVEVNEDQVTSLTIPEIYNRMRLDPNCAVRFFVKAKDIYMVMIFLGWHTPMDQCMTG